MLCLRRGSLGRGYKDTDHKDRGASTRGPYPDRVYEITSTGRNLFKMAAHFIPPVIQDNAEGWGPCSMPTEFKDIPYQPFSKGDRIGKVCSSYSIRD